MTTTRYGAIDGHGARGRSKRRRCGVAVIAVAGLVLGACGGDDDDAAESDAPAVTAAATADTTEPPPDDTEAPPADTEAPSEGTEPPANTEAAAEGTEAPPTGEASLDDLSMEELYELAQEEGSVTVYTPIRPESMDAMAAQFNAEYPGIDLEVVSLNVDEIVSRINTEQRGGQYAADVVVNDGFRLQQLASIEAIVPYEPSVMPELLEGLDTLEGFSSVAFVTTRAVAYNPQAVADKGMDEPTSLEDLAEPEWRENFATTPHGVDIYTGLIAAYGEERATELIEALGDNLPRLVESNSQAITQVQSGDLTAAISYGTYASPAKESDPSSLDFFNTNPLLTTTYFQAVAAEAPHPAAARLFINWFGTPEGQQSMVDETGFTSIRSDVENDPAVWDPSVWEPVFVTTLELEEYNEQLEQYRAAMNVP